MGKVLTSQALPKGAISWVTFPWGQLVNISLVTFPRGQPVNIFLVTFPWERLVFLIPSDPADTLIFELPIPLNSSFYQIFRKKTTSRLGNALCLSHSLFTRRVLVGPTHPGGEEASIAGPREVLWCPGAGPSSATKSESSRSPAGAKESAKRCGKASRSWEVTPL